MESKTGKESVVSRLFGFGRKPEPQPQSDSELEPGAESGPPAPAQRGEPTAEGGFARADQDGDSVTIPEQVIRVRTGRRTKDDAISAISDSFRELTGLLGSVSDRLDRQDTRTGDLADQLRELPEYLRTLPQLHQEQNASLRGIGEEIALGNDVIRTVGVGQADAMREVAGALQRVPEAQEEQSRAVLALGEKVAEGNEAVHGVADAVVKTTEELRERSHAQEEALRQVATAQHQTAKVIHNSQQKSLQLFHAATQKTLQTVQKRAEDQKDQMDQVLEASERNMKRMFWLAVVCMALTAAAVAGVVLLG